MGKSQYIKHINAKSRKFMILISKLRSLYFPFQRLVYTFVAEFVKLVKPEV